jgi:hypothetical protein
MSEILKSKVEEIADTLQIGMDNRLIDQDFAKERKALEAKINALREELQPLRTKVQFGDNTKETYRDHEEIVHEMLELEVEILFLGYDGSDVIREVALQYGAENIPEDKEEILAEFKAAFEAGLGT